MKNPDLKLSIIVPVYNQVRYLSACMDSLLMQLPVQAQILLIDDGSDDGSEQLCDEYGKHPQVVVFHQNNQGLAAARNRGLALAEGTYIGFCDSDDFVHPQMVPKLLYSLEKHQADMIVCGYIRTAERSCQLPDSKGYPVRVLHNDQAFRMLVSGIEPMKSYAWNKIVKKALFTDLCYPTGRIYEDQFVTYQLVDRAEKVLVTDWPAYAYIDNPDSITNARWSPRELDYVEAWQQIADYCRSAHPSCYEIARDQLVSASAYSLRRLLRSGSREPEAAALLKEKILKNGHGYGRSHVKTATAKRRLFVRSILAGEKLRLKGKTENHPADLDSEPPIYVEMSGRAGNQLFRYAFARWLMEQTGGPRRLVLDFSNIDKEREKGLMEGWEDSLKDFCVLPYEKDPRKALDRFTSVEEKLFLSAMKAVEYPLKQKGTNARLAFHKKLLPWLDRHGLYLLFVGYDYPFKPRGGQRMIVSGPFECARYCEEIRPILLKEFVPRQPLLEKNQGLMDRIRATNAVCVTVRRGNYLNYKALDVCTQAYFERAAKELARQVENPVFFVFSDVLAWTRRLSLPGPVFFESGTDPVWEKLRLMSACRHFIISNSTFSWWAQFLGQSPDKIVMAPDHWFNGEYQPPLIEKGWQLVEV